MSCHEGTKQHRRDDRDRVGLEKIGGHTGAITDVVTDIVGDDARVAGIVLGNSDFDFADEVGADVGALSKDTAAKPGEDRYQRAAESKADQCVNRVVRRDAGSR